MCVPVRTVILYYVKTIQFIQATVMQKLNILQNTLYHRHEIQKMSWKLFSCIMGQNSPQHQFSHEWNKWENSHDSIKDCNCIVALQIQSLELGLGSLGPDHGLHWQMIKMPFPELNLVKNTCDQVINSSKSILKRSYCWKPSSMVVWVSLSRALLPGLCFCTIMTL